MAPIALTTALATALLLGPMAAPASSAPGTAPSGTSPSGTSAAGTPAAGTSATAPDAKVGRAAATGPPVASQTWWLDLGAVDADDANVASDGGRLKLAGGDAAAASAADPQLLGTLVTAPRRLAVAADRFAANVDASKPADTDVQVDVRGRGTGPTWSEWTPAGIPLATPATTVQVRLTLHGTSGVGPTVRAVRITASRGPAGPDVLVAQPLAFRVFATREGLVGHTTANGHVITQRDHFAALPSRRGLSPRGTGDYSVMVCAANGRCAWAPVWDVGPWNTRDDYWNGGTVRQNWADLPRGVPQAQAALQQGYNGGRDQYNRQVRNPAGIDLADGTFWDGLRLTDNSWVTVTYLWTGGAAVVGTVRTSGVPLNVRTTPDTVNAPVGLAGNGARVHVECQVVGQQATGTQGTTSVWLRIAPGRYVSKAHVAAAPAPTCG